MNQKLATILYELSVLYELKGVAFKPRALERASAVIAALGEDVADIYKRDGLEGLEHIPGVGKGIADRIVEYITTKHVREYDALKKKLPVDIAGIMAIEGIGPKTLRLLYAKLGITTRAKLEKFARAGRLAGVRGIGEKGEQRILRAIGYLAQLQNRFSPGLIWTQIRDIADRVESWPQVKELELVGSLRRMQETIGDLDLLAVSDDTEDTLRRFVSLPQVRSVYTHGERNARVRLKMGIDADLWVVPQESYGAALIAWTGDKAHNIHLRTIAKKKGYLLDDYGLFKGTKAVAGDTEQSVYKKLGMQHIPPELRTDSGEIEAALNGELPAVVGYGDIKGDLQVQTDWTDGQDSILTMAKAARSLGLEYIAITDHTKSLTIAHGLDAIRIRKQWAEIDRVQKQLSGIRILKGTECDIKKDGTLDLPDEILAQLAVVGISVHSHFDLPEPIQTQRLIRAMENPYAHIVFHPTGRLIGRRSGYAVDIQTLLKAAKRTHTVMEINAHPGRLDLNDQHIRAALSLGVRLSIDTDAHAVGELGYMQWGIGQARRGWAQKRDIINTRPWKQMLKLLK
ncbi:MAG: DNA polymerase/3'-5' exonuclease PolX [Patescibacteria group bacterium]